MKDFYLSRLKSQTYALKTILIENITDFLFRKQDSWKTRLDEDIDRIDQCFSYDLSNPDFDES
jgi:hypothetical protein